MRILFGLAFLGAIILAPIGVLFSSQVTLGPSLVGLACLMAIAARIFQAESIADTAAKAQAPAATAEQIQCVACRTVSARGPKYCPQCGHEYFTPVAAKA